MLQEWERSPCMLLVEKPGDKVSPLGTPRHKWMDNIKMDLGYIGRSGMDWIGLVKVRYRRKVLLNSVTILRIPYNAGNFLGSWTSGGF
jgi:hypothetical protein